jgi:hypothetical protein
MLHSYLVTLMHDGAFKGCTTPSEIAKKAATIVARDVPAVLGDMVEQVVASGANSIGGMIQNLANDIQEKGIVAVWSALQKDYDTGARTVRRVARSRR